MGYGDRWMEHQEEKWQDEQEEIAKKARAKKARAKKASPTSRGSTMKIRITFELDEEARLLIARGADCPASRAECIDWLNGCVSSTLQQMEDDRRRTAEAEAERRAHHECL